MGMISLELYKLRRKHLFLTVILFLFVEIGWAFIATSMSIARNPDNAGWEALIAMLSSMNGLFLPVLVAVCVSRICDMEHKGNTWKMLLTLSVRPGALYSAKYASACFIMFVPCVLQVLAIATYGIINGFGQPVPIFLLFRFLAGIVITNMTVTAFQQWVSMTVKNQAFALALGMIGGFTGMAADLFPEGIRRIFVWSYYTGLSPVTQSYTSENIQFIIRDAGSLLPVMLVLIAAGIGIYLAGCVHVTRQEV